MSAMQEAVELPSLEPVISKCEFYESIPDIYFLDIGP